MICPHCGADNADTNAYCTNCGQKLIGPVNDDLMQEDQEDEAPKASQPQRDTNPQADLWKGVLCYITGVGFLAVYLITFKQKRSGFLATHLNNSLMIYLLQLVLQRGLVTNIAYVSAQAAKVVNYASLVVIYALLFYCIREAIMGRATKCPLLGKIQIIR